MLGASGQIDSEHIDSELIGASELDSDLDSGTTHELPMNYPGMLFWVVTTKDYPVVLGSSWAVRRGLRAN